MAESLASYGSISVIGRRREMEDAVDGGGRVFNQRFEKPDRDDELKRIEVSGGKVVNWNWTTGDYYLKPFVIPEPEVTVSNRTEMDEFMIIASDGLWDVVSNDLACQLVRRCLYGQLKSNRSLTTETAAAALTELAMARGSKITLAVIVVNLMRSRLS
ncbi:Protein phosphatase 2C 7 [Forsythia ovata]|uniref:Protein phosphatase 2C 7 n=1 Tax=Forsythia ovata TaxID=205694 RepID=A0ABD1XAA1_9LAMI